MGYNFVTSFFHQPIKVVIVISLFIFGFGLAEIRPMFVVALKYVKLIRLGLGIFVDSK